MQLKEFRKRNGILAKKLAEILGVSYRQYHRIETGKSSMSGEKAEKLSKVYGLPKEYFLGVENERGDTNENIV